MKKYLSLFCLLLMMSGSLMAQTPAGHNIFIDYEKFAVDGILRYINCGNDASFNPGNELTMEVWLRVNDSGWNQKIFGKLNPSFNSGYMLAVDQGKIYPELWNPTHYEAKDGFVPPTQFWVHFATTYQAGGELRTFVNGINVGSQAVTSSPVTANGDDFIIGIAPWDLSNFQYFGELDEIRIWNVAKTDAQIADGIHRTLSGSETGLIAYYDFNEATGTTLTDLSPNGNNGSFVGLTSEDWAESRAVIANDEAQSMSELAAIWNGKGFTDPRFVVTDNGLSLSSILTDLDYVVFGHNMGAGVSTTGIPASAPAGFERLDRSWYINAVGSVNADLTFNLLNGSGGGAVLDTTLAAENYTLLRGTSASGPFDEALYAANSRSGSTLTFDGLVLEDGYYTIGVGSTPIASPNALAPDLAQVLGINLFPNPTSGAFQLTFDRASRTSMHLRILNPVGQILSQEILPPTPAGFSYQRDLAELPEGMYIVQLRSEEGLFSQPIIKR